MFRDLQRSTENYVHGIPFIEYNIQRMTFRELYSQKHSENYV